jgi:hypothetical protein
LTACMVTLILLADLVDCRLSKGFGLVGGLHQKYA